MATPTAEATINKQALIVFGETAFLLGALDADDADGLAPRRNGNA